MKHQIDISWMKTRKKFNYSRYVFLSVIISLILFSQFHISPQPVYAQFASSATISADCPETVAPGNAMTCSIIVTNTSLDIIGNPAALEGPLVLYYGLFGADYHHINAFGSASFTVSAGIPGVWIANNGLPAGAVETVEVELSINPDAHITTNGTFQKIDAVLYQTQDVGGLPPFIPPASAIANNDDFFEFSPEADLVVNVTAISQQVSPSGWAICEVEIRNNGPSDVDGASLSSFITGSASLGGLSPDRADLYVPAGQTRSYNFGVLANEDANPGDTITCGASVSYPTGYTATGSGPRSDTDLINITDFLPQTDVEVTSITLRSGGPVVPGQSHIFDIVVENNGPESALNAVLTLSFDDILLSTVNGSAPVGWTFTPDPVSFTSDQPLPVNTSQAFSLTVQFPSDAHYLAANPIDMIQARISASNPDPDFNNNSTSLTFDTQAQTSLTINKTLLNDSLVGISPGGTAYYEIQTCNIGSSDIDGIAVLDTPGSGMDAGSLVTSTQSADDYISAGDCASYIFTINLEDTNAIGDTFINSVELESSTVVDGAGATLPYSLTLSSPATAVAVTGDYLPNADMDATGNVIPLTNPPVAGQTYTYEIYIENHGPAPATGATVHHGLAGVPGSWQISNIPGSNAWKCDGNGQTCTRIGSMPVGRELVATFAILLPMNQLTDGLGTPIGLFFHDLQVTANNPDPILVNNTFSIPGYATGVADLSVQKSDLKDPIGKGEDLIYELVVRNLGPSTLQGDEVILTDILPDEVQFLGASPECVYDTIQLGGAVICLVPEILNPGDSYDFLISVKIDDNLVPPITITNTVTADAPNLENIWTVFPDNNTETTHIIGGPYADLQLTKVLIPNNGVPAGEVFYYWLLIDNLGPDPAQNIVLNDLLVSEGSFEILDIADDRTGVCSGPGTAAQNVVGGYEFFLECNLDYLHEGDRWTIVLSARATEAIDVNNMANVVSDFDDVNLANNFTEQVIEITDVADLAITHQVMGEVQEMHFAGIKFDLSNPGSFPAAPSYSADSGQVTAGRRIRYELTISNNGPSTADNVLVTDRMPANLSFVPGALLTSAGTCQLGIPGDPLNPLTCGLGNLAPGTVVTVTFDVATNAALPTGSVLNNDAFVSSDVFDPDNSDNFVASLIVVDSWSDLSITKIQEPVIALPGEDIQYTVSLMNAGPSDASSIAIVDLLPNQVTDVIWTCLAYGNASCPEYGSGNIDHTVMLPAGRKIVYTVVGEMLQNSDSSIFTNTVSVTTLDSNSDPITTNNSASVMNKPFITYMPVGFKSQYVSSDPGLITKSIWSSKSKDPKVIKSKGHQFTKQDY